MQNKTLLFWILNSDKKPLYVNTSGNVEAGTGVTKTDGTPAHIDASPDGWSDTLVKWGRNNKYLGLFREFSVPLNFVKDGAKILRNAMWRIGIEAVLYFSISKLNRTAFPDVYDQWYTGEFDFSKFKQTRDGVDVQIVEGGLSKLLKAYEGTTFEVPINTNPNRFSLYLDGLTFKNDVQWSIFEDQDPISGDGKYIGAGIISQEGTTQGVLVQDSTNDFTGGYPNELWISNVQNKSITQHYSVTVRVKVLEDCHINILLQKRSKTVGGITPVVNYDIVQDNYTAGQNIVETVTHDIPMVDGDKLYLIAGSPAPGTGLDYYKVMGGTVDLYYNVRFDPALCECLSWMELFERLTMLLTKGKYGAKSNFLSSLTGTQAVTSGQAIRQYRSDAVIKTSMNDFFKACQRWGVGLAIENDQLIIEPYAYFFGTNTMIELGEVKDFEGGPAEDLIFNTIKVGYPNQTYDNVNGKDEFNVTQQYTTPITRIVKELDLVCPYRADMFGIELTRLRLFQKDTTDNKADNDTFIMNVEKGTTYDYYRGTFETQINTGSYFFLFPTVLFNLTPGQIMSFDGNDYTVLNTTYVIVGSTLVQVAEPVINEVLDGTVTVFDSEVYHLNRPAYSAITGLINPDEAFNIELSPKESLLNNASYIHSVQDMQDAGKLSFQSGEKNSHLSRTLAGRTVTENADLNIFDLPAKLFKPYYFKFRTQVPINLPAIMKATPYELVSFTYNGFTYKGFIWDSGIAPAKDDSQEWILLSAPGNDLTRLI